jgi:hypothetical protein
VETPHHSLCFLGPLEAYREVMLANGDGDKVIWVTQFGWAVADGPVPGYEYAADNTCEEQAQWIIEAYRWAADQAWDVSVYSIVSRGSAMFNGNVGFHVPPIQLTCSP